MTSRSRSRSRSRARAGDRRPLAAWLRRRWKLLAIAAALTPALAFAAAYGYLWFETRSPPPPLTLGPPPRLGSAATPDGIWRSGRSGKLEIVGSWIESGSLPTPNGLVRVSRPLDLTSLSPRHSVHVDDGAGIEAVVVWRGNVIRIKGTARGAPLRLTFTRTRPR
jgi:hypothetical protein